MGKKTLELALLILLAALILFPGSKRMSLWDRDEACNSECAREMYIRHDLIVPTFNGSLRTDKPPMEYWCMMLSYSLFGVNEFSARLPSVIAGILTVITTYLLAEYVCPGCGLFSAMILLLNLHFPIIARAATPDSLLLLFLTLSLYFLIRERFTLAWVFMAFATLTKGPIGFVIPIGVRVLYDTMNEGKPKIKGLLNIRGILLFLLIALPWYVLVDIKTHNRFFEGFILYHNIRRFMKPIGGHKGPAIYYLLVILIVFIPWLFCLFPAFKSAFEKALKKNHNFLFLYLWVFFVFFFFSLARTKLPNYIAPSYPAISTILAPYVKERKRYFKTAASLTFVVLLALPLILIPRLEALKPSPIFAQKIKGQNCKSYRIITVPFFYPSLVWYTDHRVIRVKKLRKLKYELEFSNADECIFIVTKEKLVKQIESITDRSWKLIDRRNSLYPHGRLALLMSINPPRDCRLPHFHSRQARKRHPFF